MAKKSVTHRNLKRQKLVAQHSAKRDELRKTAVNFNLSDEERDLARFKLQAMPRDTARVRVRNRCQFTGRSRGVYRKYMISRICLRELTHKGLIPGMKKASW